MDTPDEKTPSITPRNSSVAEDAAERNLTSVVGAAAPLEERRVAIEERRIALEERRHLADADRKPDRVGRNSVVITSIVAVATVLVSALQLWRTDSLNRRQLELQREQNKALLEQQSLASTRDWNLRFAEFVAQHSKEIFSEDSLARARMRETMFLAYPRELLTGLLDKVLVASRSPAVKRDWARARADAQLVLGNPGLVRVNLSPGIRPRELIDAPISDAMDVWYAPARMSSDRNAPRFFGRGTLAVSGLVPAGEWVFWLQQVNDSLVISDTSRVAVLPQLGAEFFIGRKRWPPPPKLP